MTEKKIRDFDLTESDKQRFRSKFNPKGADECWDWEGTKSRSGYALLWVGGFNCRASRVSYMIANGAIDNRKLVMHTCDRPICVNPNHLRLGTHNDNMADKKQKDRTPKGAQNANSKLNDAIVRQIKVDAAAMTQTDIAKKYGIGQTSISNILTGKTWKHVQ